MLKIDKLHCTGCGACIQRCPKHCITFEQGDLGHIFPQIDPTECIECGLCEKVCPIEQPETRPEGQRVYAAVNKDDTILMDSTSGGFFTAIAKLVLSQNGVVYGCAFDESFQARHIRVDNAENLGKLRGSKYLQSDTGKTFLEAETDLKNGVLVLYTGTPCQIAGLNSFLQKSYGNLITVDIVCHGVGSQAFFDKYMEFIQQRDGSVKELHFRDKKMAGWSCGGAAISEDRKGQAVRRPFYDYNNYYYYYFLQGDIYRDSCYSCKYANTKRPGDFTMGDFWGVEKYSVSVDSNNGCSLVIANTDYARKLLELLRETMNIGEVTMEQATKANGQLVHPSAQSSCRADLISQFAVLSGKEIDLRFRKDHKKAIAKLHLKALIPYSVKRRLRKILK